MASSTDTTEVAAEAEAAFAIDLARSDSLQKAIELWGQRPVFLMWRMGWCTGKSAGLEQAQRIMTDGH